MDGDGFNSDGVIDTLEIPIYSGGALLLTLPMNSVQITGVTMNAARTLIGTPNAAPGSSTFAADWDAAGSLSGFITFEAAEGVFIEDLGRTLCALLCGMACTDEDSGDLIDPTTCTNPPGAEGYELQAGIGGGATTITM